LVLALPLLIGDGRSVVRDVVALASLPIIFEIGHDFGQRPTTTALRVLALVLVVLVLPLDEPADEVQAPPRDRRPAASPR
jgi:hypothetical protein